MAPIDPVIFGLLWPCDAEGLLEGTCAHGMWVHSQDVGAAYHLHRNCWETDFYPVLVLGGNCVRSMRLPDPSPVLDKNCAPMGPEILSSTGAWVWRKASMAFPDSSSVLDKFQFANYSKINCSKQFYCVT